MGEVSTSRHKQEGLVERPAPELGPAVRVAESPRPDTE